MLPTIKQAFVYGICSASLCGLIAGCTPVQSQTDDAEALAISAAADAGIDRADVAAVVEGNIVTQSQVDEAVTCFRAAHGISSDTGYGQYLSRTGYSDWDIRAKSLKSLIDDQLVLCEARRLGIEVDDQVVTEQIESLSSRYPSQQAWVNALSHGGYTEQSYRQAVYMALLTYEVRDAIIPEVEPTNDQISQYAVVIAPTLIGRRSSHILFESTDYATAVKVHGLLAGGADFSQMVREYSIDGSKEQDGDMGWDSINTYSDDYQDALDQLDVGQISPIVRTGFGYHIIKCTDRYDAPVNPDGSIDLNAIPVDLMDYIKHSMASTLREQEFSKYLGNLEATSTLAAFDQQGEQVSPEDIGLSTQVVDIVADGISDASPDEEFDGQVDTEQGLIDPSRVADLMHLLHPFEGSAAKQ